MTETQPPLKLPGAHEAVLHPDKLRRYALSADHEKGREKARVFRSALGLTSEDWQYLRDEILERLPKSEVTRIESRGYGYEYVVLVWIDGRNGATHPVSTRWIVQPNQPPRLETLWVDI